MTKDPFTTTYMGFDTLPMSSPQRKEGVRLATIICTENGTWKEWNEITRFEMLKLVEKYNVRYLGTDNPSEIINNGESLAQFCNNLSPYCDFIHVNLTKSGTTIPIRTLLQRHKINSGRGKLSPLKTGRVLIELMQIGVGMILEPFENETLINVGRSKGSSKGGWSQARYQRQNEEVVAREAEKIRRTLEENKLPFDEIIQKTKYGAKMARFHIFKHRKNIKAIFSSLSFYPAKVRIWSPKKTVITHRPIVNHQIQQNITNSIHQQRLIVGIDPGMTTGVAIINLNGNIVNIFSRKNLSKGQLLSEIIKFGVPVLICSDVNPVPTLVAKVAATFNAKISSPKIELSKIDKRFFSNKTDINRRINSHERDALAAVSRGFEQFEPHFLKIEKFGLNSKQKDLSKGLIIRGLSISDSVASVKLLQRPKKPIVSEVITKNLNIENLLKSNSELLARISNLLEDLAVGENIISNLRAHTGRLDAEKQLMKNKIFKLNNILSKIKSKETRKALNNEIIKKKDNQIKMFRRKLKNSEIQISRQRNQIRDLEEILWITLDQGGHPVKILKKFSHDAIEKLRLKHGIFDDDIILMLDPTGGGPQTAENLAKKHIKFIFTLEKEPSVQALDIFFNSEIPVLMAEKYDIVWTDYLGLINNKNLKMAFKDYDLYFQNKIHLEKTEKIMLAIENYQFERNKELQKITFDYDNYEPKEESFDDTKQ